MLVPGDGVCESMPTISPLQKGVADMYRGISNDNIAISLLVIELHEELQGYHNPGDAVLNVHAYTLNNRDDSLPLVHSLSIKSARIRNDATIERTALYNSICPSARFVSISFISDSFAYWKTACSRNVSSLNASDVSCAVVTASSSCRWIYQADW